MNCYEHTLIAKQDLSESKTKKLVDKWNSTGLLEGSGNETETSGMAVLLENQARQLINEFSTTSPAGTSTSNQEEWSGVALPLVRRILAEIAAQEFVSVQPIVPSDPEPPQFV